ncbi:MAG TPA: hypothetical protein ENN84_05135 [Candidatus Marinimicrobia bacterium]|nr:hypothetical protein [Candidatus Neomarinimicrobiota bacterium]
MKRLYLDTIFFFLGRGLQYLSRYDPMIRREISVWPDGFTFSFYVSPSGPALHILKEKGKLRFKGLEWYDSDLIIFFKQQDAAFQIFSMQLPFYTAYARHLASVKGDPGNAMIIYRLFNRLQTLMLPRFIARRVLKTISPLQKKDWILRFGLYFSGLLFG